MLKELGDQRIGRAVLLEVGRVHQLLARWTLARVLLEAHLDDLFELAAEGL
eukprot:CAMPEP_0182546056 /NCGR_PEP_ID=MMETSP1323-20130603/35446_1 /TAXON_ID=236787 /ORGANISM="Florenciella parvula, Strain RCC1693" /LENGTH=50 /DNA_ID=CAMNT_0024757249 /DNA_START=19 /DNA_END=168 /DNA_ORIENTATION=-